MKFTDIQPGKYIIAVSGGVDSIVLLDLLVKHNNLELIVAHFDHGIRESSHKDAMFVEGLAKKYRLEFVSERAELGENASEETARKVRYAYLQEVKKEHSAAAIITAHHADDVLETVIINIIRGTGWRGLSALRNEKIVLRPLLHMKKDEIYTYAKQNKLLWQEDETNQDSKYLRNYVRLNIVPKLTTIKKEQFLKLHDKQGELQKQIDEQVLQILEIARVKKNEYSRYFFINSNEVAAIELLKFLTRATYPQLRAALIMIKTARANTTHQIGGGVELAFTRTSFIVAYPSLMIS